MPVSVGANHSALNDTNTSTTDNTTSPILASMSMPPTLSALSTLAEFLLSNAKIILSKPVNGNLQLARFLFVTWYDNKKAQHRKNYQKKSKNRSKNKIKKASVASLTSKLATASITDACLWEAFLKCLIELKRIAKYSFSLKGSDIYGLNDNDIKRLQELLEIYTANKKDEGVKGSNQVFNLAEWSDLEFEFLDEFELRILLNKLSVNVKDPPKGVIPNKNEKHSSTPKNSAAKDNDDSNDFEMLMDLLDVKPTSNTSNVSKRYAGNNQNLQNNEKFDHANYEPHYELIYDLLDISTARQILAAEKHALTTPKKPFLNICNNHNHCYQVGAIAQFASPSSGGGDERSFNNNGNDRRGASGNSNGGSNSLNSFNNIEIKIDRKSFAKLPSDVKACLNSKIHFIPIIKSSISKQKTTGGPGTALMGADDKTFFSQYSPSVHHHSSQTLIANAQGTTQTDLSLGDCSYLDTCYKLNSCRYVHYYKLLPVEELNREIVRCEQFNSTIADSERISDFCWNESFGSHMQSLLPAQWINCDVNKFDFDVLGKFSAIVADPAWNIHMNLPYGASNDKELSGLPIPQLQDEGIIFLWVTGRAIELGKSCLSTWGYENINEIIWIKTNQLNRTICTGRTGHWLNHSKEHLLVGIKGNPKWLHRGSDVDIIVSSTRETSRKPDELYGIVERLVGKKSRKLEIFGRQHNTRPGWFTIGNQLNGINIYEKEVARKYAVFQGLKNGNSSNAFRK